MNEKTEIINDVESVALDFILRLENCDSFTEDEKDYWFFYNMLCTFERMLVDIHQYQMFDNLGSTQKQG